MEQLIDPSKFDSITAAAESVGVPRSTLKSAVYEGYVASVTCPSGLRLVSLASARQWAASERRPGRKPAVSG